MPPPAMDDAPKFRTETTMDRIWPRIRLALALGGLLIVDQIITSFGKGGCSTVSMLFIINFLPKSSFACFV